MAHDLAQSNEDDSNVEFACMKCGYVIGFNKPHVGEPAAVQTDGGWIPPPDAEVCCSPCSS